MNVKTYQDVLVNCKSNTKIGFLLDWLSFTENVYDTKEKAKIKDNIFYPIKPTCEEIWVGKYTYALSINSVLRQVKIFNPNDGGWQRLEFKYPTDATHIYFKIKNGGTWDACIPLLLKIKDKHCAIWCENLNDWYELKSGYRFSNNLFDLRKCYDSPVLLLRK